MNKEFRFTLDPCANDHNKKCDIYFDKNENGLIKSWKGHSVFVHPPYSRPIQALFIEKCYTEWVINNIDIVLLIPVRTDTIVFHKYIYDYCELRFIKGRLKFSNNKNSAPFPSMICIYHKF